MCLVDADLTGRQRHAAWHRCLVVGPRFTPCASLLVTQERTGATFSKTLTSLGGEDSSGESSSGEGDSGEGSSGEGDNVGDNESTPNTTPGSGDIGTFDSDLPLFSTSVYAWQGAA